MIPVCLDFLIGWEYWNPEKILTKAKSALFALFDTTMHHQLRDINELAEEIKILYTGKILKTVAHQIQEVCKEEKQAWNELYEDEDMRENLLTEVDKWAEREACIYHFKISRGLAQISSKGNRIILY